MEDSPSCFEEWGLDAGIHMIILHFFHFKAQIRVEP